MMKREKERRKKRRSKKRKSKKEAREKEMRKRQERERKGRGEGEGGKQRVDGHNAAPVGMGAWLGGNSAHERPIK